VSIDKVVDKDPKETSKEDKEQEEIKETKEEAHKRREAEAVDLIGKNCVIS
jgi:hypothetical protein